MSGGMGAGRRRGRVVSYDESAGHGILGDGVGEWFFHCTAIADGSRVIAIGADIDFALAPGHLGRWEGRDIRLA